MLAVAHDRTGPESRPGFQVQSRSARPRALAGVTGPITTGAGPRLRQSFCSRPVTWVTAAPPRSHAQRLQVSAVIYTRTGGTAEMELPVLAYMPRWRGQRSWGEGTEVLLGVAGCVSSSPTSRNRRRGVPAPIVWFNAPSSTSVPSPVVVYPPLVGVKPFFDEIAFSTACSQESLSGRIVHTPFRAHLRGGVMRVVRRAPTAGDRPCKPGVCRSRGNAVVRRSWIPPDHRPSPSAVLSLSYFYGSALSLARHGAAWLQAHALVHAEGLAALVRDIEPDQEFARQHRADLEFVQPLMVAICPALEPGQL